MAGTSKGCSGPCFTQKTVYNLVTHFSAGVAAVDATGYKTESGRHLTITDGSVTADSNGFTVGPAALASFEWDRERVVTGGGEDLGGGRIFKRIGNVKTNYSGGAALTNDMAGTSKGCSGP